MVAPEMGITIFDRKMIEDGHYWFGKLNREIRISNLRLDFPRPSVYSPHRDQIEIELSGQLYERLNKLTGGGPFLLYTTLMAVLKVCLYKYTRDTTVTVGSPTRRRDDEADTITALAIVDDLDDRMSFKQLLVNVRQTLLEAYERQRYPFNKLLNDLKLEGIKNRCPLFDILMEFAEIHGRAPELKNDITISWSKKTDRLNGQFRFSNGLFKSETIERFANHLLNLLWAAVENKDALLRDLDLLGKTEHYQLLIEWNDTASDYPSDSCFHQLFETQVERTPDAVAAMFKREQLTYSRLNECANRLAHRLRSSGVGPDTPVAICVDRSLDMIIGILGILKAGGAFAPLDPSLPADRLAFMLEDTQTPVLVSQSWLKELLPQGAKYTIYLDEERALPSEEEVGSLASLVRSNNLAYVIYTSGSTGEPKGVMISQRGLVNYLTWCLSAYRLDEGGGAPINSPFGFDLTLTSLFPPLLAGKRIALLDEDEGIDGLNSALVSMGDFSLVKITPAHLDIIKHGITSDQAAGLTRAFVIGGEALAWEHLSFWHAHAPETRIINEYGPTETVVGCCVFEALGQNYSEGGVPIGRPIANTRIYLLDHNYHPVPVSVAGEIYIGGDGLARGYLDRPRLTAEKFIPDPYACAPGSRLYRSGDLGAYLPDGNIDFLGRADHQVKIRGYRIELGEIEASLIQHPAVREATVLVKEYAAGDKRLVAYYQIEDGKPPSVTELRNFIARRLPDYAIPSSFVALEKLPLTVNGKVDRKALSLLESRGAEHGRALAQPRTPIEEVLATIWSQVLGLDEISADDNFFDLGGHSLLATQVVSRVRKIFDIELPLRRLFDSPTVAGLASWIESAIRREERLEATAIKPIPRDKDLPLSFAQQRLWFLDQLATDKSIYNGSIAIRLIGALDKKALTRTINEIVNRHEILRTTFTAPDGQPIQVINPPQAMILHETILTGLPEDEREESILKILKEKSKKPFDLAKGPPWLIRLFQMGEQDYIALFVMHHIISDAWSLGLLVREVAASYNSLSENEEPSLPVLPIQYVDYAVWQRNWLRPHVVDTLLNYWKEQLKNVPPLLNLPTDYPRPSAQIHSGATIFFTIEAELTNNLGKLMRRHGVTMFMTLLAGFQALLHRYSGQDNIAVGSPIANRNRAETEGLIGCLVNTLVLHTDLSGNPTYKELLMRVREVCLGAYTHQDLPFEILVKELQPERRTGHTTMFDVWFVLQNAPMEGLELGGLKLSEVGLEIDGAQFDLVMSLVETGKEIRGTVTYKTCLFEQRTIEVMLQHYRKILEFGAGDEGIGILDAPLEESSVECSAIVSSVAVHHESEAQFAIGAL